MSACIDPLVAPHPAEVPLALAPLARVIVQLRFPEVLSVDNREFVAPFQEAIRATYPVLRAEQTQGLVLGPNGLVPSTPQTTWRFSDPEGHFRVSLTPEFLALETTKYRSRDDLVARLEVVAAALQAHVRPAQLDRVGVRYIDRLDASAVDDLAQLVRPEVRGISGTLAAAHARVAVSESLFELPGAQVLARWGVLPPNASIDPAALEPLPERSWVLDLDMFSTGPMPVDIGRVAQTTRSFAERIYTIFRWAVTDEFLARYGGTP